MLPSMTPFQRLLAFAALALAASACAPGYIDAKRLEQRGQSPAACRKSCSELEMGAFVLAGDTVPGCVCVPRSEKPAASTLGGASGGAGGFVLIAAAVRQQQLQGQQELQRQQQQREQQQQQSITDRSGLQRQASAPAMTPLPLR